MNIIVIFVYAMIFLLSFKVSFKTYILKEKIIFSIFLFSQMTISLLLINEYKIYFFMDFVIELLKNTLNIQ